MVRPALPSEGKKTAGSVAHVYPASDSGVLELPGPDGFRTRPPHRLRGLEDPGTSSGSWRAGPTCLPSLPLHFAQLVILSLPPVFDRPGRTRAGDGRKLAFGHRHLRRRRRRRSAKLRYLARETLALPELKAPWSHLTECRVRMTA